MPRPCKLSYLVVNCGLWAVGASLDACTNGDLTDASFDLAQTVDGDAFLQVRSGRSSNGTLAITIDTDGDPTMQNTDPDLIHTHRKSFLSKDNQMVQSSISTVAADHGGPGTLLHSGVLDRPVLEYDAHVKVSGLADTTFNMISPAGTMYDHSRNTLSLQQLPVPDVRQRKHDHSTATLSQQQLPTPGVRRREQHARSDEMPHEDAERSDPNDKPVKTLLTPLVFDHSRFEEFVVPTSDDIYRLRPLLVACVLSVCLIFAALVRLHTIRPSKREEEKEVASMETKTSKNIRDGCDVSTRESQHASLGIEWSELKDVDIGRLIRAYPERFQKAARRGLPPEYRWRVWKAAVNFTDQELVSQYDELCEEENQWSQDIKADLHLVFSDAPGFDKEALYRLLNAYANLHPEVGYYQGMASTLGHLFWMSRDEEESLGVFRCLMFTLGLSGFYKPDVPLMKVYTSACEELIVETLPKMWEHLMREGIEPAMYLEQWFLTLFVDCLPLAVLPLVWDNVICNGLPMILSISVAIFQSLEDALLAMRYESLVICLHDLKAYESDTSSVQLYSIGQLISKLEHLDLPPQHILEYLPVNHWSGDMQGKCLNGHPMIVFLTPHDRFACDKCRKLVAKDSPLHGCRACNFDMCQSCFSERS